MELDRGVNQGSLSQRWQDRVSARRMGMGAAFAAMLPPLVAMILDPFRETMLGIIPLIMVGFGFALIVGLPLIVLVSSAGLISREDAHEDYRKLRLAAIPASEIAQTFLEGAQVNLRYVWAVAWGIAAGVFVALIHVFVNGYLNIELCGGIGSGRSGTYSLGACPQADQPLDTFPYSVPTALMALALGAFLVLMLCMLAIHLGAYIGLRIRDNVSTALVALIALALSAVIGLAYLIYHYSDYTLPIFILTIITVPLFCLTLANMLSRRVEGLIEDRLTKTSSAYIPPAPF